MLNQAFFRLLSLTTTRRFSNLFGDKNQYVVVNSANLCNSGSTALGGWSSFFCQISKSPKTFPVQEVSSLTQVITSVLLFLLPISLTVLIIIIIIILIVIINTITR